MCAHGTPVLSFSNTFTDTLPADTKYVQDQDLPLYYSRALCYCTPDLFINFLACKYYNNNKYNYLLKILVIKLIIGLLLA